MKEDFQKSFTVNFTKFKNTSKNPFLVTAKDCPDFSQGSTLLNTTFFKDENQYSDRLKDALASDKTLFMSFCSKYRKQLKIK